MSSRKDRALAALLGAALSAAAGQALAASTVERPYHLEPVAGSSLKRVILTAKGAQRIDVQTGQISKAASGKLIAPYGALHYDNSGTSWVYTSPEPLSFVRAKVTVERIEGDTVVLVDGPPEGTRVVTVGAAELFGAESGVGH